MHAESAEIAEAYRTITIHRFALHTVLRILREILFSQFHCNQIIKLLSGIN